MSEDTLAELAVRVSLRDELAKALDQLERRVEEFGDSANESLGTAGSGANELSEAFSGIGDIVSNLGSDGALGAVGDVVSGITGKVEELAGSFTQLATGAGGVGALASSLGIVAAALTAGAAASTAYVAAGTDFAHSAQEQISAVTPLAERIGITEEAYTRLGYAAEQVGADSERVYDVLQDLTQRAVNGAKDFERWGVATKDLNGGLLSSEEILRNVANRIAKASSATEQLAAADELGNDALVELLPLLRGGADALDRYGAEAQAAGAIISTYQVAVNRDFKDALESQEVAFDSLTRTVGSTFQPVLTTVYEEWGKFNLEMGEVVEELAPELRRAFTTIVEVVVDLTRVLTTGVPTALRALGSAVDVIIGWDLGSPLTAAGDAVERLQGRLQTLSQRLGEVTGEVKTSAVPALEEEARLRSIVTEETKKQTSAYRGQRTAVADLYANAQHQLALLISRAREAGEVDWAATLVGQADRLEELRGGIPALARDLERLQELQAAFARSSPLEQQLAQGYFGFDPEANTASLEATREALAAARAEYQNLTSTTAELFAGSEEEESRREVAAREAKVLQERLQQLQAFFQTRKEAIVSDFEERQALITELEASGVEANFDQLRIENAARLETELTRLAAEGEAKRTQIKTQGEQERLRVEQQVGALRQRAAQQVTGALISIGSALISSQEQDGKAAFAFQQAAAVAQIVVNTAIGISNAYRDLPIYAAPAAAVAIGAIGAAQIGTVIATSIGSGGSASVPSAGFSGPSAGSLPDVPDTPSDQERRNDEGSIAVFAIGDSSVDELVDLIADKINTGDRVIISRGSRQAEELRG